MRKESRSARSGDLPVAFEVTATIRSAHLGPTSPAPIEIKESICIVLDEGNALVQELNGLARFRSALGAKVKAALAKGMSLLPGGAPYASIELDVRDHHFREPIEKIRYSLELASKDEGTWRFRSSEAYPEKVVVHDNLEEALKDFSGELEKATAFLMECLAFKTILKE